MTHIRIDCTPMAVQSFRVTIIGGHARKYQPKSVHEYKAMVRTLAMSQLPADFRPYNEPVALVCSYMFPIPKSLRKRDIKRIDNGETVYKPTRPDLDNCGKATRDALTGVMWTDDSLVVIDMSRKVYAHRPGIDVRVFQISDTEAISMFEWSPQENGFTERHQFDERQQTFAFYQQQQENEESDAKAEL